MVDCLLMLLNILANQLKHIMLNLNCLVVVEQFWKYPEVHTKCIEKNYHIKESSLVLATVSLENNGKAKLKNGRWSGHSFEPVGHPLKSLVLMQIVNISISMMFIMLLIMTVMMLMLMLMMMITSIKEVNFGSL